LDHLAKIIGAATGLKLNKAQLRAMADGITDNMHRFNIGEGLTHGEDQPPKRFSSEVLPGSNESITREQMAVLLKEYYAARNWDENGVPKSAG
jgi:aldehyde:ferredoxin oxidoreductase